MASQVDDDLVVKFCLTFATSWTRAPQAPLSMGFPRQEYWNRLPFPSPGDLPDPRIKLVSPALAGGLLHCKQIHYHWATREVLKNPPANSGDIRDAGLIPESGRSPGGGHGNPLQYSCLENPMDKGTWWATVHRVSQSWTQLKWLSTHTMLKKQNILHSDPRWAYIYR